MKAETYANFQIGWESSNPRYLPLSSPLPLSTSLFSSLRSYIYHLFSLLVFFFKGWRGVDHHGETSNCSVLFRGHLPLGQSISPLLLPSLPPPSLSFSLPLFLLSAPLTLSNSSSTFVTEEILSLMHKYIHPPLHTIRRLL